MRESANVARIIVSVINDLFTDQRVDRVCRYLSERGHDVLLVGRKLPGSKPLDQRPYRTHRMGLIFRKGPLFYAEYNIRLFFLLLWRRTDRVIANDPDTLPANYLAARTKGIDIFYDAHEFFTEVPELKDRPLVKKVWLFIERTIIPRLQYVYTVNETLARIYSERHGVAVHTVRNVPSLERTRKIRTPSRTELGLSEDHFILIFQAGGINIERGLEELIEAMSRLGERYQLLIIGGGDIVERLKALAATFSVDKNVSFLGKRSFEHMMQYTKVSDLGLCIDKGTNLNYRYSLPNKIFEYIHAGIPMLVSDLPETRKIVERYRVGRILDPVRPDAIAHKVSELARDVEFRSDARSNALKAAEELCWEKEIKTLNAIHGHSG